MPDLNARGQHGAAGKDHVESVVHALQRGLVHGAVAAQFSAGHDPHALAKAHQGHLLAPVDDGVAGRVALFAQRSTDAIAAQGDHGQAQAQRREQVCGLGASADDDGIVRPGRVFALQLQASGAPGAAGLQSLHKALRLESCSCGLCGLPLHQRGQAAVGGASLREIQGACECGLLAQRGLTQAGLGGIQCLAARAGLGQRCQCRFQLLMVGLAAQQHQAAVDIFRVQLPLPPQRLLELLAALGERLQCRHRGCGFAGFAQAPPSLAPLP